MKKLKVFLVLLGLVLLGATGFTQNSVVGGIEVNIGGKKYTFYNRPQVNMEIVLRELRIAGNNNEIKYLNSQKIRVIERKKLSTWESLFDKDVQEYNRQIKVAEDENRRYKNEISQLNRVLIRYFT